MKKITWGVLVFSVIALLGVEVITAFPFGFGKGIMAQELTEEGQTEFQEFQNSLRTVIENEDFDSWKYLMESQLTEENFNRIIEMHQQEERRAEMEEKREEFCEENDCPTFEEGEFSKDFEGHPEHKMKMGFRMPFLEDNSNSE